MGFCMSLRSALCAALLAVIALLRPAPAAAERLRDLTEVSGARENQLIGYGLVTGLNGTGDDVQVPFTGQSVLALLRRLGIQADPTALRLRNVAAVAVTATLPAFARPGTRIDVTVSSLGNARSLQGGVLVQTVLKGADQQPYAVAQGPLLVGGFQAGGATGSSVRAGSPTAARIVSGALVERDVSPVLVEEGRITLGLRTPGFTVAQRVAVAINQVFADAARARDSGSVVITLPGGTNAENLVAFLAQIEDIEVEPVRRARVVINERTGTVVAGGDVRLAPVAVVHGTLTIVVRETPQVSQPGGIANPGARTAVVPQSEVTSTETNRPMIYLPAAATLSNVASALSTLGLTPRELSSVLDALRAAGALAAEVVIQ
jgi:flagellar P-ring protein precursor FlgI